METCGGRSLSTPPIHQRPFHCFIDVREDVFKDHDECRKTISGEIIDERIEPELPSRVLDVGEGSNSPIFCLFEVNGRHGHYITLSHCWGSFGKWPLRTTSSEEDDREQDQGSWVSDEGLADSWYSWPVTGALKPEAPFSRIWVVIESDIFCQG